MSAPRAIVALLLVFVAPAVVYAHLGSTKYLHVDATETGARVIADLDPVDLAYELGLEDADAPDVSALLARRNDVKRWAERAFTMRSDGGPCEASAAEPEIIEHASMPRGARAMRISLELTCPAPRTGLVLHDGAVFGADPQHEAVVRIADHATILRAGRQDAAVGDSPAPAATVLTFLLEGAIHLVTGYDHVLFLISLLLVAGALAAKKGVRLAASDVALVVTGFTVGHSITLIAAALDVVSLPSRLVESLIAASIAFVAGWNLVRPGARHGLRWVAVAFGLIHGFGFSSVLRELVLPTGERVAALLSFNVGIELAQLAIVAIVIGPLAWAGRKKWYEPVVIRGGSIAVGAIGLFWLAERAFAA